MNKQDVNKDGAQAQRLGAVVGGSLGEGLDVHLDADVSVEDVKVGRFVTIQGQKQRFFGVVTDVALASADQRLSAIPPDASDPFIAQVLAGTGAYGLITVTPMLTLGGGIAGIEGPQPVKTVPSHFSEARTATDADVELVFGREDEHHFVVGTPLDMETRVCLDLHEFVKRSNGVFGKSGTGKSFLTRLLLIGIIQKQAAVNLVFDMHNDYGWEAPREGGPPVKGLKQFAPGRVAVLTLDPENARRRRVSTDGDVQIGFEDVQPEDIAMLRETLNLTPLAAQSVYRLVKRFGSKKWLGEFLALDAEGVNALAAELGEHEGTLHNLRRGLDRLGRMGFLAPRAPVDSVQTILSNLQQGKHVVLEFGRYGEDLAAYVLVANMLTRRIRERYVHLMEQAQGDRGQMPRPVVITIEEAHKFLSPEVAGMTAFGTIAREMRKYNVTLLVVDQRPSGIDEEVMSQIGTKITCLLDNERDIDAVLTGVSGSRELRGVLAKLETKQQALIFGHAVPMPVVIKTREYGTAKSYAELKFADASQLKRAAEDDIDLFPKQ
ncbi:MAG: ATP-binding protein [Dehalococcoidia bacterium]|nr:ATP-binding protein [Dehalococcoidia bacterium]